MDEVLDGVDPLVHAGNGHERQHRRPGPDDPDQVGKWCPPLDPVLHPRRVAGQRPAQDARGGVRPVLAEHQVGGQVAGVPAGAQRRCVRSCLVEQRAQRQALVSRVTHLLMVGGIATLTEDRNEGAMLDPVIAARLKRDASGLIAAIAQQYDTGEVLMLGWMDDEALHRTLTTGRCTYWSRSRQEYWVKGETSGHQQWVRSVALDCDGDALLVKVDQIGGACHTGDRTCFDADVLLKEQ
jgi:phosphoribosyl-AMP cyclohydrolase